MSSGVNRSQAEKGPSSYENWKAAEAGVPIHRKYEYPLYTDANIIGDDLADGYGPYLLMNACPNPWLKQARPTLVLYAEQHLRYDPEVRLEPRSDMNRKRQGT
jgi:hypothetical protein